MKTKTTFAPVLLATLALTARAQDGAREQAVARQIESQVRGQSASQPTTRGENAVARLVRKLDEGNVPQGIDLSAQPGTLTHAWLELHDLGPLAVDTIYRLLPELGAFGVRNSLRLLLYVPDERLAQLLEQMLRGSSFANQLSAAELIEKLPAAERKRLAALAVDSGNPLVRAHGIVNLVACNAAVSSVRGELQALLAAEDRWACGVLWKVLGSPPFRGESGRRILEDLVKGGHEVGFTRLVGAWLDALPQAQHGEARAVLEAVGANQACRTAIAQGLLEARPPVNPLLCDLLLDLPSDHDRGVALGAIAKARLHIAPATLLALRASTEGELLGQLHNYLTYAPLDASDAAMLESGAMDSSLQVSLRERHLRALDKVAPQRVVVRARELLSDGGLVGCAEGLLAEHVTPQLVPALVAHVVARQREGRGVTDKLLQAIIANSDATNLRPMFDLIRSTGSGYTALQRWFTHEQIPELVRDFWWAQGSNADLKALVARVATPDEGVVLAELFFEALRRRQKEIAGGSGQPSEAQKTLEWLRGLLPTLDGEALRKSLATRLLDRDAKARAAALKLALSLKGTDRQATLQTVLSVAWSADIVPSLLGVSELAQDAALRDRFVHGVLAIDWNHEVIEDAMSQQLWKEFLMAMPAEARRKVAIATLDAHTKNPSLASLACVALQTLGRDRLPADAERFRQLLGDDDSSVRSVALAQLARMTDKAALPGLLEALKDENDEIRQQAKSGLQRLEEYLEAEQRWKQLTK